MPNSTQRSFAWHRVLLGAVLVLCLQTTGTAAERHPGLGTVTSIQGTVIRQSKDGSTNQLHLHQTQALGETTLRTVSGSSVIYCLSNNIALGLSGNSELACLEFQQAAFTDDAASMEREPSTSVLHLKITRGTVVLSAQHISPLSEAKVILPVGELTLLSNHSVIEVEGNSTYVTVLEGAVTFFNAGDERRQYLTAPMRVRISPQSVQLGRLQPVSEDNVLSEPIAGFAEDVPHASSRVFYTAATLQSGSKPILTVSPTYFDQPVARPYEFLEEAE